MRAFALLLLLAGCSSVSATPTVLQDGRPGYAVTCNGNMETMTACHLKAMEVCPAGYFVQGRESENRELLGASPGFVGRMGLKRSLLVRCRA